MKRADVLDATESILKQAGFNISQRCCSRPSCFDLAARREEHVAFVKVHANIGSALVKDASELKTISTYFSAVPLFVSERNREKPLEDDTVYSRYDIYDVTPKTLENIVARKMYPLVEAGPGGYYVRLDVENLRERRQGLGLSAGKMAEMMGISRRTLYGYEMGMTKASVSAAYNLEWILGVPLVKPIDIFQPTNALKEEGLLATAKRMIKRHQFLQKLLKKFSCRNFRVAQTRKAPFDFVAQFPDRQLNIIGAVAYKSEQNVDDRVEEIVSVSKVVEAQPVLITDGRLVSNDEIALIHREEIENIKSPLELLKRL